MYAPCYTATAAAAASAAVAAKATAAVVVDVAAAVVVVAAAASAAVVIVVAAVVVAVQCLGYRRDMMVPYHFLILARRLLRIARRYRQHAGGTCDGSSAQLGAVVEFPLEAISQDKKDR